MPTEPPAKIHGIPRRDFPPDKWDYKFWGYGGIVVTRFEEGFKVTLALTRDAGAHRHETTTWTAPTGVPESLEIALESALEELRSAIRRELTNVSYLADQSRIRANRLRNHLYQVLGHTGEDNPSLWERLDGVSSEEP